jgi:hypothetical protein
MPKRLSSKKKNVNLKKSIRKKNYKLKAGGEDEELVPPPVPPMRRVRADPATGNPNPNGDLLPPPPASNLPTDFQSYKLLYNQLDQAAKAIIQHGPEHENEWLAIIKRDINREYPELIKNLHIIICKSL